MNVEITMIHWRCYRCRRWYGGETNDTPCGGCALDQMREKDAEINRLARSNAALRGVLKRRGKRR